MFRNIYGKRILFSLRDRSTMIWTLIFPLVLGTLFFAVFGGIDTSGLLETSPLGVVNDEAFRQDEAFKVALESVSGEDGLFELHIFENTSDADSALENGDITGYVIAGDIPTLIITSDGISQTIAKSFLDRFIQTRSSIIHVIATNPAAAADLPALLAPVTFTEEITLSNNPPSNVLNYFYALFAMVSMYGGFQGLNTVVYLQANMSALGARRTVSPAKRWKLVLYDLLGGLTIQFACLVILVAYLSLVLGIDFGSQVGLILLTCLAGSMLGVSFGAMVSVSSKFKENAKVAILISVSMLSVFLSGLMVGGINYIIAQRAPIVAWINPAARITDAFYSLYFYDTYGHFFLNIGIVFGMSVIMFIITAVFLRRQRYESI
ncbi:MAG: ABC transporter permease [Oscillospiraceae bacterium]|nr:ABC transporter permease [Oscillospiraceae bacterium]